MRRAAQQQVDNKYLQEFYGQQDEEATLKALYLAHQPLWAQKAREGDAAVNLRRLLSLAGEQEEEASAIDAQAKKRMQERREREEQRQKEMAVEKEHSCWTLVQVELMRGDEQYRKLDALYRQALDHNTRLVDENSLLDEIVHQFQETRKQSGPLCAQLLEISSQLPVPPIPPYDRFRTPYTGEKHKYPVFFGGKTAVATARVLPLPQTGPVTPLYGGPASAVKHVVQEPTEHRAEREKLENLESLLSQVLLEVERRRDASKSRCYYLPAWENDPHELAKLHALYQMRERKLQERITGGETELQGVVASFDSYSSRVFVQKASGAAAKWGLRTGCLKTIKFKDT
jgi:hypothetical protein